MSYVRTGTATITTTATGAATVYTEVLNGLVQTIKVVCSGTTSTADVTITGETSGVPILTKANLIKSSTNWFHPRAPVHTVASGGTASGGAMVPVTTERIKAVMVQGGNAQSYTLAFYVI